MNPQTSQNYNQCAHNPKEFEVSFDTGSLGKTDVWLLCRICNEKPEFKRHRISEETIGEKKE